MTGETVYIDGQPVDNILVTSSGTNMLGSKDSATDIEDLIGPIADYKLYFPMDYQEDLTGRKITVRGIECEVLGHPDHERPVQVFGSWSTPWDMVVSVRRTLPENAEYIVLNYTLVERDHLGNRLVSNPVELWSGMAQARQSAAAENKDGTGRVASVTYYFVLPYLATVRTLPTQCLTVVYRGKTYDVEAVENIDEKDETMTMRAVWRDDG